MIRFTHYWVTGFGWENTVFCPEDFETVEFLGESEKDGKVWICFNPGTSGHILKGYIEN
jgi:hypothetical protein